MAYLRVSLGKKKWCLWSDQYIPTFDFSVLQDVKFLFQEGMIKDGHFCHVLWPCILPIKQNLPHQAFSVSTVPAIVITGSKPADKHLNFCAYEDSCTSENYSLALFIILHFHTTQKNIFENSSNY